MIHASVELVEAVGGVSPYMATRLGRTLREEAFGFRAAEGRKWLRPLMGERKRNARQNEGL